MIIILRTDNNSSINFEEIDAQNYYRTTPAQHMNLYGIDAEEYTKSGYLITFLYGPTKNSNSGKRNREHVPDALTATSSFSEGRKYIHFIVLDDSNVHAIEKIELEGTVKMEIGANGPGIKRVFIDKKHDENNPLEEIPIFSPDKIQLFYTRKVHHLVEPGHYKTDSEVLLGGQWYNFITNIDTLSHGDFFVFLNQYNSEALKRKKPFNEEDLIKFLSDF
ncbi:MAG: hypothetical protein ACRCXC_06905 [Legionella sp.]